MILSPPIYRASMTSASYCLRQCEIISNVVRARLSIASVGDEPSVEFEIHPYALLMTQDCDLEQDFSVRQKGEINDKVLPSLLFCEVMTAGELLSRSAAGQKKQWERLNIPLNKNERFQFLQAVDPPCDAQQIGLEELALDFKRYFTVPSDEMYRRIELGEAKRRCVLNSPYLEHLSSRFGYFMSRVALPEDHSSA